MKREKATPQLKFAWWPVRSVNGAIIWMDDYYHVDVMVDIEVMYNSKPITVIGFRTDKYSVSEYVEAKLLDQI